jgi:hypothetical protein
MLCPNQLLLLLRPHKLQLFASLVLVQRVYEQIQVVHLLHLTYEFAYIGEEFGRVNVINKVNVDLVLAEEAERAPVFFCLNICDQLLKHGDTRVNTLKIAARHLKNCLDTVHCH